MVRGVFLHICTLLGLRLYLVVHFLVRPFFFFIIALYRYRGGRLGSGCGCWFFAFLALMT